MTFTARGASVFFVPPGDVGNWDVPTNWAPTQPVEGDTAFLHAGRVGTVNTVVAGSPTILRIADFNAAPIDGELNVVSGGELLVHDQMLVGIGGDPDIYGVVNQSGGSLTVSNALFLAFEPGNTAEYNLSGGTANVGNLWFRFGNGTVTQTGGSMTAQGLILGEGGDGSSSSLYSLQAGTFSVLGTANIGKAPGAGDPIANSLGSMQISGGVATFGEVLFGNDPTDVISISGSGMLRVNQSTFNEAAALSAIAAGNIIGNGLVVSTVIDGAQNYTQITAVPEPACLALIGIATVAASGICVRPQWRKSNLL